jgi:hypothetical protein
VSERAISAAAASSSQEDAKFSASCIRADAGKGLLNDSPAIPAHNNHRYALSVRKFDSSLCCAHHLHLNNMTGERTAWSCAACCVSFPASGSVHTRRAGRRLSGAAGLVVCIPSVPPPAAWSTVAHSAVGSDSRDTTVSDQRRLEPGTSKHQCQDAVGQSPLALQAPLLPLPPVPFVVLPPRPRASSRRSSQRTRG